MKYIDEISDFGDLGQCIYELLRVADYGVKNDLWDILNKALSDNSMEEMKEYFEYWTKERET